MLLLSNRSSAHQDFILPFCKGNVHLESISGWVNMEIHQKVVIFVQLADKLVSGKFKNSEEIFIDFRHDYTKSDTSYYALGYGEFSYWDAERYRNANETHAKGLKVIIKDRDFDIKRVLLLLNFAIVNSDFVKANQSEYVIETRYRKEGDTLNSIRFDLVEKYYSTQDTFVDNLLKREKIYRPLLKVKEARDIDYYFQDNKYHFYNTREPDEEWSDSLNKLVVVKTFGEDILTVNNVFEIVGEIRDGHLIFIDDSTFYYIPEYKDKVYGPYKIDSVQAGRRPIRTFQNDYRKFYFYIDDHNSYRKVLFIPDSNLVVSNYGHFEDSLINYLAADNGKTKSDQDNILLLSLTILELCLGVILLLSSKNRN